MTPEEIYGSDWQKQIVGFQVVRFGCPRYEETVLLKVKNGYRITHVSVNPEQIEPGRPYLILQRSSNSQLSANAA